MAANLLFFYVHLNKAFKPCCCVETLSNYKHINEAQKANLNARKIILNWQPFKVPIIPRIFLVFQK